MDYVFTFIEGFASFISPCILPMIPIYISYFLGKDNKKTRIILVDELDRCLPEYAIKVLEIFE